MDTSLQYYLSKSKTAPHYETTLKSTLASKSFLKYILLSKGNHVLASHPSTNCAHSQEGTCQMHNFEIKRLHPLMIAVFWQRTNIQTNGNYYE